MEIENILFTITPLRSTYGICTFPSWQLSAARLGEYFHWAIQQVSVEAEVMITSREWKVTPDLLLDPHTSSKRKESLHSWVGGCRGNEPQYYEKQGFPTKQWNSGDALVFPRLVVMMNQQLQWPWHERTKQLRAQDFKRKEEGHGEKSQRICKACTFEE